MAAKSSKKNPTFEEGLNRLEEIAGQMEQGTLPLEELMKLYEEGMTLSQSLNARLDEAESKIKLVRCGDDGKPVLSNAIVAEQQSFGEGLTE